MIIILFWTLSCLCGHKDTNLRAIHNGFRGGERIDDVAFVGTKILI